MTIKVNLSALKHNYRTLQNLSLAQNISAVVKADAYGCGVFSVVKALTEVECSTFFVATLDEACALRKHYQDINIAVFEGLTQEDLSIYREFKLIPIINTADQMQYIDRQKLKAIIHIDTGMNRLGLHISDIAILQKKIIKLYQDQDISYVMSHLACADSANHPMNQKQKDNFLYLKTLFPCIPMSLCNSAGILYHSIDDDLGRPGIALYGGIKQPDIKNVVTITAPILQIRNIKKGESVGYGADFISSQDMKICTVGYGYADGFPRILSGTSYKAYHKGYYLPLLGRVSMDSIVLDVSQVPLEDLHDGDEIQLIGDYNSLDLCAQLAHTIPYEILTNLSRRMRRIYVD